jgi:hypothetical protein
MFEKAIKRPLKSFLRRKNKDLGSDPEPDLELFDSQIQIWI